MLPLLLAQALAGDCALTDGVYLLTMEPGDGVQTIFGHTAVLFYDRQQGGYSPVYDYGRFTVDPLPQMAWEVLTMTKPYFMGSRNLDETVARYDRLGRGIVAQRLALTEAEAQALSQRLAEDLNGDLHFDYNWYRPNCTTMVQDRLDEVLGGVLSRAGAEPGSSPADEVLRHSGPHLPLWLGLRWGSGRFAHTAVSTYDAAFLPDGLRASVASARRGGQPLATDTCVVGEVVPTPVPPEGPSRLPALAGLGLVAGGVTAGAAQGSRSAGLGLVALTGLGLGLWGTAALLVGSLGTFAPFWGHHNLAFASPLSLLLVGAAVGAFRRPDAAWPQRIALGLLGLGLLGVAWSATGAFADQNLGLAAATLLPIMGATWVLRPSHPA